jgi:hypothetical protein
VLADSFCAFLLKFRFGSRANHLNLIVQGRNYSELTKKKVQRRIRAGGASCRKTGPSAQKRKS